MIRKKFFRYFAAFAIIPVICFSLLASVYIFANEVKTKKEDAIDLVQTVTQNIEKLITEAYQIGNTVSEDSNMQEALHKSFSSVKERYATDLLENNDLLYISKYFDKNIHVYVIGKNGGLYKSGYLSFRKDTFLNQEWYRTIVEADKPVWFDIHKDSFVANTLDMSYLSFGVPIKDASTKEFLGVVLVELQVDSTFEDILKKEEEKIYVLHPNTDMSIENGNVKLYEDNKIVAIENDVVTYEPSEKKPSYIAETMRDIHYWNNDFNKQGVIDKDGYFVNYQQLEFNNWIIVSVIENGELYKNIYNIFVVAVIFLIPLLLIVFYVSYALSNSVSKPILLLKGKVEEVQRGNFDVSIQRVSEDEIGELSDQFNQMVVEIKILMQRIYDEQTKLKNYELMLLQAQINPHFLYNTLDSLQWLIRMNQLEDAIKMTTALTRFFVTGLNKGNDIIRMKEEMENAQSYLVIQQLRYKSKLNYYIYCEKEIEEFRIPKLILQPFVENAIYHGIKGKELGGIIEIRGYYEAGYIHLIIADDGLGMSKDKLDALLEDMDDLETEKTDSYGIKNVNARLKLFYKNNYRIEIKSDTDIGTYVAISIKEDDHV